MSFQYYNYYDDDSDVEDKSVSSSGDEGGFSDDIVISDGKQRRFRLNRSRSSSHSRSRSRSRLNSRDTTDPSVTQPSDAANAGNSSSLSGMEEEMEKELDQTVKAAHEEYKRQLNATAIVPSTSTAALPSTDVAQKPSKQDKKYDDVYFDSDEEVQNSDVDRKSRNVLSHDELFYDPDMDDADQKWVDNVRRQYQPDKSEPNSSAQTPKQQAAPLPNSDAVLNCPACMSLLCVDCQRHDIYSHQYRAMFVFNCKVDHSQLMRYEEKAGLSNRKREHQSRKRRFELETAGTSSQEMSMTAATSEQQPKLNAQDLYCPVNCTSCNTCVAMFDSDEVYHFFNVLASHT